MSEMQAVDSAIKEAYLTIKIKLGINATQRSRISMLKSLRLLIIININLMIKYITP